MRKNKKIVESVSRLIESDLERAELVLAAQAITDKLQDMAERVAKIEADDVMPILDSLKSAFGPQASERFNQVSTDKIRGVLEALKGAKDGISSEVSRFEKMVNGGGSNDMALDDFSDDTSDDLPDDGNLDTDATDAADLDLGDDEAAIKPEVKAPSFPDEDDFAENNFAGRAKKESKAIRGKKLNENHKSPNFDSNMVNLSMFHGKAGEIARQIEAEIDELPVDGSERRNLLNVLDHLAIMGPDNIHWDVDADDIVETVARSNKLDTRIPEIKKIVNQMKKLAHCCAFKHEELNEEDMAMFNDTNRDMGIVETRAIKALRESKNPDAMILATFRKLLSESKLDAVGSAKYCAKTFGVDVSDVVSIIKEAKAKKMPAAFLANIKKKKIKEDAEFPLQQDKKTVPLPFKNKKVHQKVREEVAVEKPKPEFAPKRFEKTVKGPGYENREPTTTGKPPFKSMEAGNVDPSDKAAEVVSNKKVGSVTLMSKQAERGIKNESAKVATKKVAPKAKK